MRYDFRSPNAEMESWTESKASSVTMAMKITTMHASVSLLIHQHNCIEWICVQLAGKLAVETGFDTTATSSAMAEISETSPAHLCEMGQLM